ncbi:MAG: heme-binding domain-containing protein [Gemmatimonadetes bacterium]|nr:heme-binding domain-containing protein [Gemmatimonadota bacterium]
MPLRIYLPLHPEAGLSVADAETLIEWSRSERAIVEAAPAE